MTELQFYNKYKNYNFPFPVDLRFPLEKEVDNLLQAIFPITEKELRKD